MQWPKRVLKLLGIPEVTFKPLRVEGEPLEGFGLEEWKSIAEVFVRVPGLKVAVEGDFQDTLGLLAACLKGDKNHFELIRLGQKLVDLNTTLRLPHSGAEGANKLIQSMTVAPREPDPLPPGAANVM